MTRTSSNLDRYRPESTAGGTASTSVARAAALQACDAQARRTVPTRGSPFCAIYRGPEGVNRTSAHHTSQARAEHQLLLPLWPSGELDERERTKTLHNLVEWHRERFPDGARLSGKYLEAPEDQTAWTRAAEDFRP